MRPAGNVPLTYLLPDWLRTPQLPMLVANELRAVFPVFMLALVVTALSGVFTEGVRQGISFLGYAFGCAAISSVSFGHDFTHRTLAMTIGQPIERERLWGIRLKISLALMVPLAIVAAVQLDLLRYVRQLLMTRYLVLLMIPMVSALTIAPWFTLLCRSALAGSVFGICTPVVLVYLGLWIVPVFAGEMLQSTQQTITWGFFAVGLLVSCLIGFIGTFHRFKNLEAIDGPGAGLSELTWSRPEKEISRPAIGSRKTSPWVQLVSKELRLQWISFVPAFGIVLTALASRNANATWFGGEELVLVVAFWAVTSCIIIGAAGSAEERQLGLTEAQALLPMRKSMQWMVKCAVLLLLAQLIAVSLPLALLPSELPKLTIPSAKWWSLAALLIVSASVYVSSCCRTTMKAVLVSLPTSLLVLLLLGLVYAARIQLGSSAESIPMLIVAPFLLSGAIILLLNGFACRNHFSAESARGKLIVQLLSVAGLIVITPIAWLLIAFVTGTRF